MATTLSFRLKSSLLLSLLFFLVWPVGHAQAALPEVYANYDLEYKFDLSGKSQATYVVSLRNRTSAAAVSGFELTFTQSELTNLKVFDGGGPLAATQTSIDSGTKVSITFRSPIVGLDRVRKFTIQFDGPQAIHTGQVWDITIPKFTSTSPISTLDVSLIVPTDFGKPTRSSVPYDYYSAKTIPNYQVIAYTKADLRPGLTASFGNLQSFELDLTYKLQNSTSQTARLPIVVPPDTTYQRVSYHNLTPSPETIEVDSDGNWLAYYQVPANSTLSIHLLAIINSLLEPVSEPLPVSADYLQQTLQPTTHWPKLTKNLTTPRQIYDFVITTLDYDHNLASSGTATRRGATDALAHPKNSVCTEFTDLFIALSRSAGIPAREIIGAAFSPDPATKPLSLYSSSLHAWPQYWDKASQKWISVDPTWGQTSKTNYFDTFDLHHIALLTRGQEDSLPQLSNLQLKLRTIDYAPSQASATSLTVSPPSHIFPIFPTSFRLQLSNSGQQALYGQTIKATGVNLSLGTPTTHSIAIVPPHSVSTVVQSLPPQPLLGFGSSGLRLEYNTETVDYNLPQKLFLSYQVCVVLVFVITFSLLSGLAAQAWSVHFQRHSG